MDEYSPPGTGGAAPEPTTSRPRGRPAGLPKSGGRQKGVPNKVTADLKQVILKRGRPIELLCDVARGLKVRVGPQAGPGEPTFTYPTLQDRVAAARTLLGKVVPDMKAVELSGADGGPIITVADTAEAIEARAAAWERLGAALRAGGGLAGQSVAVVSATSERRILPTPSAGRISRPINDVLQASPAPPANDGLPNGYELQQTPDGVEVHHKGRRVFLAIDRGNALTFISQHRPPS